MAAARWDQSLWTAYHNATPSRLKFIDVFLVFIILSVVIRFIHCIFVTSFRPTPSSRGSRTRSANSCSLCSQVHSAYRALFWDVSPKEGVGRFVVGSIVLDLFVFNFLG
ncbi:hypothetical protein V8E53_006845 [Lactarius tabidus]